MKSLALALAFATCTLLLLHHASSSPTPRHHRPLFPLPPITPLDPEVLKTLDLTSSAGEPLVINKYLNEPELGRNLSRIDPAFFRKHVKGTLGADPFAYSGFINVNQTYDSNMFYWFFEAINGDPNAPVVLWLQGGPGGSSMFGLFGENGPFSVGPNLELIPRNITWNSEYAMLYIDNPVGVGFSYLNNSAGLSLDEDAVAENLYSALTTFFTIYSNYASNEFYVTGESYAGKYVPALAHKIWSSNQQLPPPAVKINLAGMAIGDGLSDPYTQVQGYANLAYSIGLADENQRDVMTSMQDTVINFINNEDWANASQAFFDLIDGPPDYFQNITGLENYYDIRYAVGRSYGGNYPAFLNQASVRQALHVGDHMYGADGGEAGDALTNDICRSVKPLLTDLLENIKVMFYNGQFDFIVAPVLTELMLDNIEWSGEENYKTCNRTIWKVTPDDADIAGYVRNPPGTRFFQVIVRDAGHIVPGDQPRFAFDMIHRFISNIPFTD